MPDSAPKQGDPHSQPSGLRTLALEEGLMDILSRLPRIRALVSDGYIVDSDLLDAYMEIDRAWGLLTSAAISARSVRTKRLGGPWLPGRRP